MTTHTFPLIFLDLDGTLIGASGTPRDVMMEGLVAARETGVHLVVCTGRPSGGIATEIARTIGPTLPHIFHGGGLTTRVGPDAGDPLDAAAMDPEGLRALVQHARSVGEVLELYSPTTIFVDGPTPWGVQHATLLGLTSTTRDLEEVIREETIIKAQWIVDPAHTDALVARTPEGCFAAPAISTAMPGVSFITMTRPGADKGSAVRRVAAHLGVALEDCAAVGDSAGDLPMLEVVGHPFVMDDAPASLTTRFATLPDVARDGVLRLFDPR